METVRLPHGFPLPDAAALGRAAANIKALPDDALVLIDGLAFGVMPAVAEAEAERLRLVALVHHPLADETGLSEDQRVQLCASERVALASARAVLCTSATTAERLVFGFGVSRERIVVARPGTDPAARAAGRGDPPVVLSIGSLTRRKGHDVFLRGLSIVADRPWKARIVGTGPEAEALTHLAKALGLATRVEFLGSLPDVRAELACADMFALASRHEGFGMAFAEALAHGLPVVGCDAGAVPEVVPKSAGLLVAPNDAEAFGGALAALLDQPDLRQSLADEAWAAGQRLPVWSDAARIVAGMLEAVA